MTLRGGGQEPEAGGRDERHLCCRGSLPPAVRKGARAGEGLRDVPAGLGGALASLQGLLHVASRMRDLAGEGLFALPLARSQCQVAAGHVLGVALPLGLAGAHAISDSVAISQPGHAHISRVEVFDQTHQGGFVLLQQLRGRWEQGDFRGRPGQVCKGERVQGCQGDPVLQHRPCLPCWCCPGTLRFPHAREVIICTSNIFRFGI